MCLPALPRRSPYEEEKLGTGRVGVCVGKLVLIFPTRCPQKNIFYLFFCVLNFFFLLMVLGSGFWGAFLGAVWTVQGLILLAISLSVWYNLTVIE